MDDLCNGEEFFESDLLLHSSWPHFTSCFQDSLLIWVPCGWLWGTLPFYLIYLFRYHVGIATPINRLNISKTMLSVLLFVMAVLNILKDVSDEMAHRREGTKMQVERVRYLSYSVQAVTFLLSAFIIQLERVKGVITSGIMWIFWLLCILCGVVPFYTKLITKTYNVELFSFCQFYILYTGQLVQFVLTFFAEKTDVFGYYNVSAGPCPELQAAFPSRLVFSWMNSFIFYVYRGGLHENDLFSLHPRDQGSKVVPEFESAWDKEYQSARSRKDPEQISPSSSYASFQRVSTKTSYTESSPLIDPSTLSLEVTEGPRPSRNPASLFKVLCKLYGPELFASHLLMLLFDLLQFVPPLLLGALIKFTQDKGDLDPYAYSWKGYILCLAFLGVSIVSSTVLHQCYHLGMTLGIRIKSALTATVYKKILTMGSSARKTYPNSSIASLISVDCHRMQDLVGYLWMLWSAPLEIALALYLLWRVVGLCTLAGLGVLILLMPINAFISAACKRYQRSRVRLKDRRVQLMNELVNGMRIIKTHAWEDVFIRKVDEIRCQDLALLKKISYLNSFSTTCWTCAPYLVPMATFIAYVLTSPDNHLDPFTAYVTLALFNILRFPVNLLPMMATLLVHAVTSIRRLSAFLSQDDSQEPAMVVNPEQNAAILVEKASFQWDRHQNDLLPNLLNVTLEIPDGQLVAVVGYSGSGKSSLLSAILGQIERTKGQVTIKHSSIAYVPQHAWIHSASVKDNILFAKPLDGHLYSKVLDLCALTGDLDDFPDGEDTELGDRGIDITLDQKQRINLARAAYQEADIYLFDDVMNGIEASLSRQVFDKIISNKGMLKRKTRVLVTDDIHWLPQADVIIMMSEGRVSEMGSYEELLTAEGDFVRYVKTAVMEAGDEYGSWAKGDDPELSAIRVKMMERIKHEEDLDNSCSGDESLHTRSAEDSYMRRSRGDLTVSGITLEDLRERERWRNERILEEERVEIRKVKPWVFLSYFKAVGVLPCIFFFSFFLAYLAVNVYSNLWLASWTHDPRLRNTTMSKTHSYTRTNTIYLALYGGLGVIQALLVLLYALIASTQMVKAAGHLHKHMLTSILHAPMMFFDNTPPGRILNRFSRDVDRLDNILPQQMRSWMNTSFNTLGTLVIIAYCSPFFLVVVVPLALFYYLIQRLYIPVSRELKKMESSTRVPVHSHINETLQGASSIRAFRADERYRLDCRHLMDKNLICHFTEASLNRWLAIGVETVGNLAVFFTAFLSVVTGCDNESTVGLSVCLSLQITSGLSWMVRGLTDLESSIVSVERINQYGGICSEGTVNDTEDFTEPIPAWPKTGSLKFNHVTTREKPTFDLVLNNITCEIKDGEKVGVVATPGTDNSHLVQVLFRLVDIASGSIIVDGQQISDMQLGVLRSGINILSVQDPILFTGSLRMNLDPSESASDEDLWSALESAHLIDFVRESGQGLALHVTQFGENLSASHRQLVCLARALVHKTKILVIDDTSINPHLLVSASTDASTEELIQTCIRREFVDSTVLAVNSRINTVMDYDRVIVLDNGSVREIGSPPYLLQDDNSVFSQLAKNAHLV